MSMKENASKRCSGKYGTPEAQSGSTKSSHGIKTVPKRINKTAPPETSRISVCIKRDHGQMLRKEEI